MEQAMHFNVKLDTRFVEFNDGSKSVVLSFVDREEGVVHHFPIPANIAEDLGNEMVRLANL